MVLVACIGSNMSARDLNSFASSAMEVHRVIQQHFSMNYSYMQRAPLRNTKSCQPGPRPDRDQVRAT